MNRALEDIYAEMGEINAKIEFLQKRYLELSEEYYKLDAARHNETMEWSDGSEFDYTP